MCYLPSQRQKKIDFYLQFQFWLIINGYLQSYTETHPSAISKLANENTEINR